MRKIIFLLSLLLFHVAFAGDVLFQRPSSIAEEKEDTIICKGEKDVCKINLDLWPVFPWEKEKNKACTINYGLPEKTGQENRCNPNTVSYTESWEYSLHVRVDWKKTEFFYEKTFTLVYHKIMAHITFEKASYEKEESVTPVMIALWWLSTVFFVIFLERQKVIF